MSVENNQISFVVTKNRKAHHPDAVEGLQMSLNGAPGSDQAIEMAFHSDGFDGDRARASWLRAGYLALFAVRGFPAVMGPEMELVRLQIREPKAKHIPTFLINTGGSEDWSQRSLIEVKEPTWARCWGITVGHYIVCLPLPGDVAFYDRLYKARNDGTPFAARSSHFEWPTEPSFG